MPNVFTSILLDCNIFVISGRDGFDFNRPFVSRCPNSKTLCKTERYDCEYARDINVFGHLTHRTYMF